MTSVPLNKVRQCREMVPLVLIDGMAMIDFPFSEKQKPIYSFHYSLVEEIKHLHYTKKQLYRNSLSFNSTRSTNFFFSASERKDDVNEFFAKIRMSSFVRFKACATSK